MSEFSEFADEAKKLAGEHPDLVNKGVDEAAQVAEDKTGGRFDSQIEGGEAQAERWMGTDN